MNNEKDDATEFMLAEYQQIVAAFFDLCRQKDQMFRFYLIVIALPIPILTAFIGLGIRPAYGAKNMTEILAEMQPFINILKWMYIIIALAGFVMALIIIELRLEALGYARTVNLIRKFFVDRNKNIEQYLALPTTYKLPKFFEQPMGWHFAVSSMLFQVIFMGLIDSAFLAIGIGFIFELWDWTKLSMIFITYIAIHIILYYGLSHIREKKWEKRFNN